MLHSEYALYACMCTQLPFPAESQMVATDEIMIYINPAEAH